MKFRIKHPICAEFWLPAQEEQSLHGQADEEHQVPLLVRLAGDVGLDSWQSSSCGMGESMEE